MSSEAVPPAPEDRDQVKHPVKAILVCAGAAVGGILFGFDSSAINGAVDAIGVEFRLSSGALGFAVAIALLGCAVGAWFAGQLADLWGRRAVMVVSGIVFTANSIGSALAGSDVELMIWRFIGGLAIGTASVIAPDYIGEIAPVKWRGALGSVQQLAITLGIFGALLSDALLASGGGALQQLWWGLEAWRWMLLVGVVPAVFYGIVALLIPESPHYLIRKHRDKQAKHVLADISGVDDTDAKVSEIRESFSSASRARYRDLRGPAFGLQPILWIGMTVAALQQLVGINVIFYYSTTLWQSVGFSTEDSFTTSVITAVVNVLTTLVAIGFVDRVGRRKLLLAGSVGMTLGLLATAIAFSQSVDTGGGVSLPGGWGPVALIGANLFVVFYGASWGPVMWVTLGEIFPNRIRSLGLGIGAMVNWVFNFIITLAFPWVNTSLGPAFAYSAFTFFAFASFWFVKLALPEFKGRDLESGRIVQ
ncbi:MULTISPECIES: sugar porter family MFS transporter [unclassified Arthrobacter]|uniref:sugar porter family MFS transporter n=1 Tax=unclassified Arthrobacter TaxID=235627 RepID=UPI001D1533D3|nr:MULTISPECIES: sugar porter family MFS transporter [unclassified Arthrobacter]MCC3277026.1 sugar porter family MFS transporter [Arthrobacter sp. zg-Y20]MCC3280647.1 sugar porter family MFS transporter [Arthrobacter sp. zg-Y40]MCC9178902.1 sugar porter family MFS transporter [Arthrobacter sp. zg-Y750]MDK1317187.1 sugar porter family MFS transporter [Arthrobacter sp. zg.Y20]MDK1328947.1 sugar porter family MFS transporter [Arthrobacter sp. zg-Y1143]